MNTETTIVVGAGLSGLTAAIYLARGGRQVVLIEKSRETGGRARTQISNGFYLNLGPHALYAAGAAASILRELKIPFSGKIPDPKSVALIADSTGKLSNIFQLPKNIRTLLSTGLLSLEEKLEYLKFYSRIAKISTAAANVLSLRQWVEQNVKHKRVREVVYALFRVSTYSNDPENISAGAALAQLQLVIRGRVYYLNKGWQSLVDGLRNAAEAAGVTILVSQRVDSVEVHGSMKKVHCTQNASGVDHTIVLKGSDLVFAVSPAEIRRLIPQINTSILPTHPVRAASLDLALDGLPNRNVQFALGINCPFYFSVHSEWANVAPAGAAFIHAAKYLPNEGINDHQSVLQELESIVDALQPGWRGRIVKKRFLPELIVSHALPLAKNGGISGRPSVDQTGFSGVYITGDWVGNEGMLSDAALSSAKAAAMQILGTKDLPVAV